MDKINTFLLHLEKALKRWYIALILGLILIISAVRNGIGETSLFTFTNLFLLALGIILIRLSLFLRLKYKQFIQFKTTLKTNEEEVIDINYEIIN